MGTGSARKGFTVDETMTVLEKPEHSVVVTLAGIRLEGRPNLFQVLAARLHRLRARTGRPHWLVVQEAAHILPAGGGAPPFILPEAVFNTMLVTAQPERVHPSAIAATDVLIASGKEPERALHTWSQAAGAPVSGFCPNHLGPDQALMWQRQEYGEPSEFRIVPYGTADSR
jgi:hypothetical protein